ncbi:MULTISPECIES: head GIN domain-containing protein [Cellulophaga]|uniref:Putative auto-transporter adhesin head GIN domain-containing protein n=2 Tax=Cellulophaga TaxID=104264 RepID=F0RI37_CELLC|nr:MULTISPECIES: head GIN domain-containing protein [Cellulophaga]ADY30318.1 hypothetical protein Celly_2501 [Cellulophaga lytica DSM 7489]AIM61307.1 hypothetical protein IX49_12555 [Cellulophaga lytica]APU11211.1 hypothetical protein A5M85_13255 [Cellulophaga lytica]EWH14356.1 hypothetical protein KLA_05026 [Cellulophaga geojensis KL-A]TVZ10373.1 putative autotransporter adhesin-like protein [Cellulophaga sp. RHA_52]
MATLSKITIAVVLSLLFTSCSFNIGSGKKGNGVLTEQSRDVATSFERISASEGINVYVTQAKEFSIRVEADENVIDLIGTDIKDGKLKIHAIENIGRATKNVHVTLPVVTALYSSSGAELISESQIETNEIDLNASSGADIQIALVANSVNADCSSGADIKLSGKTNNLTVNASSGSDIDAYELKTKTCDADASSGADISVDVSDSLIADASSGADIKYSGTATVKKNKSSSGSVKKR